MVVIMDISAPKDDIEKVREKVIAVGCKPHFIYGTQKIAIGLTGPTEAIDEEEFKLMQSVEEVLRVSKKYKLVSREVKSEDTVINFGEHSIGGRELGIIAGPCSVENHDQMFEIAGQLSELGIKFLRAGAYKPRSSPYAFQGMKEKGLESKVIFLGFLNFREKTIIQKSADAVIIPSVSESFCMVFAESLACEVPVVAFDLPFWKPLYQGAGLFVQKDSLADGISAILDDARLRKQVTSKGKDLVKDYDVKKTASDYIKLYESFF